MDVKGWTAENDRKITVWGLNSQQHADEDFYEGFASEEDWFKARILEDPSVLTVDGRRARLSRRGR